MLARLNPFYHPETEEGRRVQGEERLRKAREAERRAKQAEQNARQMEARARALATKAPAPETPQTKETVEPFLRDDVYQPSDADGAYLNLQYTDGALDDILAAESLDDLRDEDD